MRCIIRNKSNTALETSLDGGIYMGVLPNDYISINGTNYKVVHRVINSDTDDLTFYVETSNDIQTFLGLGL